MTGLICFDFTLHWAAFLGNKLVVFSTFFTKTFVNSEAFGSRCMLSFGLKSEIVSGMN